MAKAVHPSGPMRAAIALVLLASLTSCKKKEDAAVSKAPTTAPVKLDLAVAAESVAPDVLTLTGTIAADQRSEVTAEFMQSRDEVARLTAEDSGSGSPARAIRRAAGPVLAGQPFNAQ